MKIQIKSFGKIGNWHGIYAIVDEKHRVYLGVEVIVRDGEQPRCCIHTTSRIRTFDIQKLKKKFLLFGLEIQVLNRVMSHLQVSCKSLEPTWAMAVDPENPYHIVSPEVDLRDFKEIIYSMIEYDRL